MKENRLVVNNLMAQGLDVIGDRWVLLILRDVFLGRSRFEEFRQHTGASRTTLTRRLESLVEADVLYKHCYSTTGKRFEYKLTQKGAALFFASLLFWQWELDWSPNSLDVLPAKLLHIPEEHALNPIAVCRHCSQPLEIDDVQWLELSEGLDQQLNEFQSFSKRRVRSTSIKHQQDQVLTYTADLIGDRWTLLILIAAFLGINRYDAFLKQLSIASNILTERLNFLVEMAIFERINYQENPPRSEYKLTKKGKSLYPLVMALRQWVVDWLAASGSGEKLLHKPCGKPLAVEVICGGCGQKPWQRDVKFPVSS